MQTKGPAICRGFFGFWGKGHMPCTACSIIPVDGKWIVRCGEQNQGPYISEGMAQRVATTEALALHRDGKRSRISIEDEAGNIRAEYCLCTDFKAARSSQASI